MASLIDIRRRLRSVKSTQQITKAMKMVAAAKLRRAQDRVVGARPYAALLGSVLASVRKHAGDLKHPLLEAREEKRVLVMVVAGERGLCGFASAIVRIAGELAVEQQGDVAVIAEHQVRVFYEFRQDRARVGVPPLP